MNIAPELQAMHTCYSYKRYLLGSCILILFSSALIFVVGLAGGYADAYAFFMALSVFCATLARGELLVTTVLVLVAFIARIFLAHLLPEWIVYDDEVGYERTAQVVLHGLESGSLSPWQGNAFGNLSGMLFFVFGASEHVIKAFNCFLGILLALYLERLTKNFTPNTNIASGAFILGLFFPANIFLSSIALKEQLVALIVVISAYYATRSKNSFDIPLALCALVMLLMFRASLSIPLICVLVLALLVRASTKRKFSKSAVFGTIMVLAVAGTGIASIVIKDYVLTTKIAMIVTGVDERGYDKLGNSEATVAGYLDTENLFSVRNIVVATLRSVFSPSPFVLMNNMSSEKWVEVLFLTSWWYICVPFFIATAWVYRFQYEGQVVVLFFGIVFLTASLAVLTFSPETFRYRWSGLPLFFWFSFLGVQERVPGISILCTVWVFLATVFGVVYLGK